jgi:protein-S-isoprenylcysteine O-methyltransferase Ste14
MPGPTLVGLALECAAFFVAFRFQPPTAEAPGTLRLALAMLPGPVAVIAAWQAVAHLGRQFRIQAGLYEDHKLVRTGPYAVVRHPIYASLLAMLVATLLAFTAWPWIPVALALFVIGTEIRVHTEDRLLASRFPKEFAEYRQRVPAYIPFVR